MSRSYGSPKSSKSRTYGSPNSKYTNTSTLQSPIIDFDDGDDSYWGKNPYADIEDTISDDDSDDSDDNNTTIKISKPIKPPNIGTSQTTSAKEYETKDDNNNNDNNVDKNKLSNISTTPINIKKVGHFIRNSLAFNPNAKHERGTRTRTEKSTRTPVKDGKEKKFSFKPNNGPNILDKMTDDENDDNKKKSKKKKKKN